MKSAFVVRGVHVPTKFNTGTETRARMFREHRLWLTTRRVAALLCGDQNLKRAWKPSKRVTWLAGHSVDNIWGSGGDWEVINRVVVELRKRRLSDHDAVKVWLRHKATGRVITVATVNLQRLAPHPAYRAEKVMQLLDADLTICCEGSGDQAKTLRSNRRLRVFQAPANRLGRGKGRGKAGWVGNMIVSRPRTVTETRRRSRPVAYIYLRGKKRSRRPRIPVPAVNWSPIVWFAFVPEKKENR